LEERVGKRRHENSILAIFRQAGRSQEESPAGGPARQNLIARCETLLRGPDRRKGARHVSANVVDELAAIAAEGRALGAATINVNEINSIET